MHFKSMVYCKLKKANEKISSNNNTRHPHSLFIKITPPSTFGCEHRFLEYVVVQLCIHKNEHFDLCTTRPTHIHCKLDNNTTKTIIRTLQTTFSVDLSSSSGGSIIKCVQFFNSSGKSTRTAMLMRQIKVCAGPVRWCINQF